MAEYYSPRPGNHICFQYACLHFPDCALAGGGCCAIEWDDIPGTEVKKEMCSSENNYAMYICKNPICHPERRAKP